MDAFSDVFPSKNRKIKPMFSNLESNKGSRLITQIQSPVSMSLKIKPSNKTFATTQLTRQSSRVINTLNSPQSRVRSAYNRSSQKSKFSYHSRQTASKLSEFKNPKVTVNVTKSSIFNTLDQRSNTKHAFSKCSKVAPEYLKTEGSEMDKFDDGYLRKMNQSFCLGDNFQQYLRESNEQNRTHLR